MKRKMMVMILIISLLMSIFSVSFSFAEMVSLPVGLQMISEEAFMGDTSLNTVSVPSGVEEIGDRAFANSSIREIHLPETITKIGADAFTNTSVIGLGMSDSYAADYFRQNGLDFEEDIFIAGVIIEEGNITLIQDDTLTLHAQIVPAAASDKGVTWESSDPGVAAVDSNGLLTAVSPGWTMISATAVDDVLYKTAIVVEVREKSDGFCRIEINPDSLTLKKNETAALQVIASDSRTLEKTLEWSSSNEKVAQISSTGVVTGISQGEAVIRAELKDYPEIWADCNVSVTESQEIISDENFEYKITDEGCVITGYKNRASKEEVIIPAEIDGVPVTGLDGTFSPSDEFYGAVGYVIPETVTYIGGKAFWMNYVTEYITTASSPKVGGCIILPKTLKHIGEYVFTYFDMKKKYDRIEIQLPDSLLSIGSGAFCYIYNLYEINIPDKVETIENWTFQGCTALEKIHFPANLKEIGLGAFRQCPNLKEVILPPGCTKIAPSAFENCTSLEKVVLSNQASFVESSFPENAEIITYDPANPPFDVDIEMSAADLFMGVGMEVTPTFTFSDGTDRSSQVVLSCDDEAVSVSGNTIIGLRGGDATICAEIPSLGLKTEFTVRVRLFINKQSLSMRAGESVRIWPGHVVILNGGPGDNLDVPFDCAWISKNPKVATVDKNGKVTAVGKGETQIICSLLNTDIYSVCKVKVTGELKLTLSSETWNLGYGDTVQVEAKLTGGNADSVHFSIVDKYGAEANNIATIDQDGWITAKKKEGSAFVSITAVFNGVTLHECQEFHVWGAWGRKGFSWKNIDFKGNLEEAGEKLLPKWKMAWDEIQETNEKIKKNYENTLDSEFVVSAHAIAISEPQFLSEDFKMALIDELINYDYRLLTFKGSGKEIFESLLFKLMDQPDTNFTFKVRRTKKGDPVDQYTAEIRRSTPGEGVADFIFRVTDANGKSYDYYAAIKSASKIKLSMEYMKDTFITEYNNLAKTVKSGTLNMLGVEKIKGYVLDWIKGKAVDYLNTEGKNWMENFGTHVEELDQLTTDIQELGGFNLTDTLPKDLVSKITGYQNKLVQFITDITGMGDCP